MVKIKKININIIVFVLVFFACDLLIVGVLLRGRMTDFLNDYTENQTRRQAETLALMAAEELECGLDDLEYIANLIENNPDKIDILLPVINDDSGIVQGLLAIDGHALYGEDLSAKVFEGIQASFRGKSAITFVDGKGLLFTYPVFHGKNIKYVLYRMYPIAAIEKKFSIECYDDLGKMCVMTRDGQIIVPFRNTSNEDVEWFESEEMAEKYSAMLIDMEIALATANIFNTSRGEQVLFEAEVPDTDYLIAGFVSKEVASEGIGNIVVLVTFVFGMMMVLMIIGILYLMNASIKLKESDELKKAMAMAEEANKAKSNFLANMSHEIRTPINAVLGMNEMILRESEDKAILTYSENIKHAGKTLLGLINDILDFSKIEAGKIDIVCVDYDLPLMIKDLVNMIRTRSDDKGLELKLDFDKELPKKLYGDEFRIKQIITNILTNAVKYTKKGSITFKIGFNKLDSDPENIMLNVSIKDTGIGIKPEDKEKLFTEFERIEEKRNRNIEGTGLGLNITKSLLGIMGSSLMVDSVYGEGSTFSFNLKQKVIDWEPIGNYGAEDIEALDKHKKYKEKFIAPLANVLVVDDNPMNLMVFESLLKKTRINIDKANNGDECIVFSGVKKYDIIFLDHMMPGKDGIETLHEIRNHEDNPNVFTPSVCLTANAISGAREGYIKEGFDDYLSKPIDAVKLEEMILQFLPADKIQEPDGDTEESEEDNKEIPEELKALSGTAIDVAQGMKNSGTLEAYMPLLKMFYESIEDRADEIEGYYENGNMKDYVIKVHALKSSARIIGAESFAVEAQEIENAGKSSDEGYINSHHSDFMSKYRSFKETLSKIFPKVDEAGENANKPEADPELMREVFSELKAASDDMDCDRIESIFAEMEEFRIPSDQAKAYAKIREAAAKYDYDKIAEIIGGMK